MKAKPKRYRVQKIAHESYVVDERMHRGWWRTVQQHFHPSLTREACKALNNALRQPTQGASS
jgi:hypothetical protein